LSVAASEPQTELAIRGISASIPAEIYFAAGSLSARTDGLIQVFPAEGAMAIVKKARPLSSAKTKWTFDLITPDAKQ
jgi:hypothetical protein